MQAGWDDAVHLDDTVKAELLASIPEWQREARRNGTPTMGSGAVYKVDPASFVVDDFPIPDYWPRVFGLDVGWNVTSCIWGAIDRDSDTVYLYSELYAGAQIPGVHAEAIKARGTFIPGVIDPASAGSSQHDGARLIDLYREQGLDLEFADNSVEAGIYTTWQRLVAGKLKLFASMSNWLREYRLYRRDEKGRLVKANDHALDASRYLLMSGLSRAQTKPVEKPLHATIEFSDSLGGGQWMY